MLCTQDLPAEEVQEDLIESGQSEEILQKSCPAEYSAFKEEEVLLDQTVSFSLPNELVV